MDKSPADTIIEAFNKSNLTATEDLLLLCMDIYVAGMKKGQELTNEVSK